MSQNDLYFGSTITQSPCIAAPHIRTIWRLERRNHRLRIVFCWAVALTFAAAFALGFVIGRRLGA